MRINAPQLFNGEILASQEWMFKQLSGLLPSCTYDKATETFTAGDIINSGMIIESVYGDTIKIDNTTEQTIKGYIEAVSGDLYSQITTGVKLGYGLTRGDDGIEVVPSAFISFAKDDDAVSGYAASYTLTIDGTATKINIPKDQFLQNAEFISAATAEDAEIYSDVTEGKSYIRFTFNISEDGLGDAVKIINMPADDLFQAYSAGNGLSVAVDGNGTTFSIVADDADDTKKYLVIGDDKIGLTGITTAISDAAEAVSGAAFAYTNKASGELIGTEADNYDVNTIYGAKAYADKVAGEAKTAASDALNTFITGTYDPFVTGTNADIDTISGVISENYTNEKTIDTRLSDVEAAIGSGTGTGSLTDRMTQAEKDIDAVEADIADIRTKAVEFKETTVEGWTGASTTVAGRVIAVFDSTDTQCYPTITYNKTTKESTLSAVLRENAVETITIVHSIIITPKA